MKILALDYGDKRIGLALGDSDAKVAVPYGILENRGRTYVLHQLNILIKKEDIGQLLIGLPLALTQKKAFAITLNDVANPVRSRPARGSATGTSGRLAFNGANEQMQKVLRFIDDARNAVAVPVETVDERLSTREADNRTHGTPKNVRAPKDAIAAAIILQNYMDKSEARKNAK